MKKMYQTPTMNVVEIEAAQMMALSEVTSVSSNLDGDDAITYGGGSNQAARVKANTVDWDDWE